MKLGAWITEQKLTHEGAAVLLEIDQVTVTRYVNGTRTPRKPIMERIVKVTGGAVTANDFMSDAGAGRVAAE